MPELRLGKWQMLEVWLAGVAALENRTVLKRAFHYLHSGRSKKAEESVRCALKEPNPHFPASYGATTSKNSPSFGFQLTVHFMPRFANAAAESTSLVDFAPLVGYARIRRHCRKPIDKPIEKPIENLSSPWQAVRAGGRGAGQAGRRGAARQGGEQSAVAASSWPGRCSVDRGGWRCGRGAVGRRAGMPPFSTTLSTALRLVPSSSPLPRGEGCTVPTARV